VKRKKMNTKIITALVIGIALVGLIGTGLVSGKSIVEQPTVEKTVLPTEVYVAGTDCAGLNEEATITIRVTGAGGEHGVVPPLDVVFAIDSSGSMGSSDPTNLRLTASKAFVDMMDPAEDQAGVVSWDSDIDFTHLLDSDFVAVNNAIDNVDSSGGTNLNVGLYEAIRVLDENTRIEDSAEVIIFLTDGGGTYTPAASGGPASDAAAKGYVIFPIGLGSGHVAGPLMDMADATGGTYYSAPSAENLEAIFDTIHEEIITSTIPHYVNVYEVTEGEIDVVGPCNPVPDDISTNPVTGYTTIIWYDIGNGNLTAEETVVLTCVIKSTEVGEDMPVQVEGMALVEYADSKGKVVGVVDIPQAYLTQIDLWIGTNKELDELIEKVDNAPMPNIIKQRLIGKLEYAKKLKDNAKEEYEAGNVEAAKKKLGVAKNQVESFESMVKITRRISPAYKKAFLKESALIKEKIDCLIEKIQIDG
jgi:Ca-activated chloride channel family protein